jgi:hypothetical protein
MGSKMPGGPRRAGSMDRHQPALTRWGIVNEYSITTAPAANMLQGAQSGGTISLQVAGALAVLRTAFSMAKASIPKRQQYAPIARKNARHITGLLLTTIRRASSMNVIDVALPQAGVSSVGGWPDLRNRRHVSAVCAIARLEPNMGDGAFDRSIPIVVHRIQFRESGKDVSLGASFVERS